MRNKLLYILLFLFTYGNPLKAQESSQLLKKVLHSKHLENTLTQENQDRQLSIYLPPSYAHSPQKRYPVIYLLHGIAGTDRDWFLPGLGGNKFSNIQQVMDEGIRQGIFGEMIVVMPNQNTNWFGSFYTNSSVTGNWEDFTTKELVDYIDKNYRTLAKRESRGIAGHSMGGYGALSLAIKNPDIYSVVYALSPAIIEFTADLAADQEFYRKVLKAKSFDELRQSNNFLAMGALTVAQAFSPNPKKAPFYADMPFKEEGGKLVPNSPAYENWLKRSPIQLLNTHLKNFKKLQGIGFDVGDQDEFAFIPVNCNTFSEELKKSGIAHFYELYEGDHRNQLMGRKGRFYAYLLPFLWERLQHE